MLQGLAVMTSVELAIGIAGDARGLVRRREGS